MSDADRFPGDCLTAVAYSLGGVSSAKCCLPHTGGLVIAHGCARIGC